MAGKFTADNQPTQRRGRGKSERTRILEAMEREGQTEDGFYDLLIKKAFNPEDTFGMGEVLKRISPLPKATLPMVEFELTKKDPSGQASEIMEAVSNGSIAPDVANMLISSLSSMIKIEEATELKDKVQQLQEALERLLDEH